MTNTFNLKLNAVGSVAMFVFLDSVANVERLSGMNMFEMFGEVERNSVEHFARCFVDKFELYMLQVLPYEFACAEIRDVAQSGSNHRNYALQVLV